MFLFRLKVKVKLAKLD